MISASVAVLTVGFTLGFLHALDADHVMAVSSLNNQRPGIKRMLRFCANWALGHGGVLLLSGILLFGVGWQLPESLQKAAEASVGLLLIAVGLWFFWQFKKHKLTLKQHSHENITHSHLHMEGDVTQHGHGRRKKQDGKKQDGKKQDGHAPVLVGVLHGLAGSAPALALVPSSSQGDVVTALGYLVVFSVGVMLSMLLFGLGLGSLQSFLQHKYLKLFAFQRYVIAGGSVALGSFWLTQVL